jgi:hypothetical protein
MASDPLPEPWRSFLQYLDTRLAGPTELHCFGGFVVAECYGLMRPTADIDILESRGIDEFRSFLGGRRHGDRCLYVSTGGSTKDDHAVKAARTRAALRAAGSRDENPCAAPARLLAVT